MDKVLSHPGKALLGTLVACAAGFFAVGWLASVRHTGPLDWAPFHADLAFAFAAAFAQLVLAGVVWFQIRFAMDALQQAREEAAATGEETRQLVRASQEQAVLAREQVEAARAQVEASERGAIEAARARIDESAPILGLTVSLGEILVLGSDWSREMVEGSPTTLGDQEWFEAELDELRFETSLRFELRNYGRMPAQVFFPGLDPELEGVRDRTGGSRYLILGPEERYGDEMRFRLEGRQASNGRQVEFVVQYSSPLTGAIDDTLRWGGQLQILRLDAGRVRQNDQIPLNAGPAQTDRTYTALEWAQRDRGRG